MKKSSNRRRSRFVAIQPQSFDERNKICIVTKKLKPRNPTVVAMYNRKAGAHKKNIKQIRAEISEKLSELS